MALAVAGLQTFDAIHIGGLEARSRPRARSLSLGARSNLSDDDDTPVGGNGVRLVVRHTFLELEEEGGSSPVLNCSHGRGRGRCVSDFASFMPSKSDGGECDTASDSTAPSGKSFEMADSTSETGSAKSPVARKWSDHSEATTAFGEIASDSASDCSEIDLLENPMADADLENTTPQNPAGPPGQHVPVMPPGNFWQSSCWSMEADSQWTDAYDQSTCGGPPGTFFHAMSTSWEHWMPGDQCETTQDLLAGENDDSNKQFEHASASMISEVLADESDAPSVDIWSKITSADRWADMDDSSPLSEERTTVMLKNLPSGFNRTLLRNLLDSQGFSCAYDFLYVPMAFRSGQCFGYAFINLVSGDKAAELVEKFHGQRATNSDESKAMEACWSDPHQGLAANINRYRNSPVMHDEVPEEHRPMLLKDGEPMDFPAPTKRIHAPRVRRTASIALDADGVPLA